MDKCERGQKSKRQSVNRKYKKIEKEGGEKKRKRCADNTYINIRVSGEVGKYNFRVAGGGGDTPTLLYNSYEKRPRKLPYLCLGIKD
jgi:hypothetical protein